jgi:hypothetical protein
MGSLTSTIYTSNGAPKPTIRADCDCPLVHLLASPDTPAPAFLRRVSPSPMLFDTLNIHPVYNTDAQSGIRIAEIDARTLGSRGMKDSKAGDIRASA